MLKLYTIMKKDGIIMTTQAKGTLLQKSRRMLGRGYELFTIQEIKLAQKLQKKFSFGYVLGRVLGFMVKLLIAVILFFVLGWVLLFALAALGFFMVKQPVKETKIEENSTWYNDMSSNQ